MKVYDSQHLDLSLSPQKACKNLGMATHACNPSAEKQRHTDKIWEFIGQLAKPKQQMRDTVSRE